MASAEDAHNVPTVRELAAQLGVTVRCGDGDAPTVLDTAARQAAGKELPLLGRYPVTGRLGAGGRARCWRWPTSTWGGRWRRR